MKPILIAFTLLVVLLACGWIVFRNDAQRPSLELRTDKVKADVQHILQETREMVTTPNQTTTKQDVPMNQTER